MSHYNNQGSIWEQRSVWEYTNILQRRLLSNLLRKFVNIGVLKEVFLITTDFLFTFQTNCKKQFWTEYERSIVYCLNHQCFLDVYGSIVSKHILKTESIFVDFQSCMIFLRRLFSSAVSPISLSTNRKKRAMMNVEFSLMQIWS